MFDGNVRTSCSFCLVVSPLGNGWYAANAQQLAKMVRRIKVSNDVVIVKERLGHMMTQTDNRQTNRQTGRQTDRQTNKQTHNKDINKKVDKQTKGQTDRQTEKSWTYKQTDRQHGD